MVRLTGTSSRIFCSPAQVREQSESRDVTEGDKGGCSCEVLLVLFVAWEKLAVKSNSDAGFLFNGNYIKD